MATSTAPPWYYTFEVLEDERYIPMVVIGSISSFLSMLGSGCVLYMSFRERRKLMHRIMFGLSTADFISSTSSLLMPYLIPSYLGLAGASGNHASCTAVGFFLMTFILVGCCYNAMLSGYFYLVVCRSWKERDFAKRQESVLHLVTLLVPLALNFVAVGTQSINPSPLINNVCTYATSPWTCNENEDLDCTRSNASTTTGIVTGGALFLFIFTVMGFLCTFLVWNKVRVTVHRSRTYRFEGDTSNNNNNTSAADERVLQVRTQAILYSLVYLNTFIWAFVGAMLSNRNVNTAEEIQEKKLTTSFYVFQLLYWTCYPLQGFLNFFVYTRLRVQRRRKAEPERPLLGVYKDVILTSSSANPQAISSTMRHNTNNNNSNKDDTQRRNGSDQPEALPDSDFD